MISLSQTERMASKFCRQCNGRLATPGNFCRWCGVHLTKAPVTAVSKTDWHEQTTLLMSNDGQEYSSLATLSLTALTQTVVVKTRSLRMNQFGVFVVVVLTAIPMWMIIILLSPFDAYRSAKTAAGQIDMP